MRKILVALIGLMFIVESAFAAVTISTTSKTFQKAGGAASITISGTGDWTAAADVSWIVIRQGASGSGAGSCVYMVNANMTADVRVGHIVIGGNTYTVTQSGYAATISPASASFERAGGSGTISVSTDAGISWTAVSNDDWITVVDGAGTSVGVASYTVAPYYGVVTRAGSISIAGQNFTITQKGTDVSLQPEEVNVKADVDLISISITALATTKWDVEPDVDWVSIVDKQSGYGDYQLTLAVNANPSFARRIAKVKIGSATLTVEQEGVETTSLSINPPEARAAATGAYGNVAVLATPDAPWKAESLTPWLTISEGLSGAGNGNIKYVTAANPTLEERVGQIRISPQNAEPNLDLTAGLICHIPSFMSDEGNPGRYFMWGDLVWTGSTQTDLQKAANTWLPITGSSAKVVTNTTWDGISAINFNNQNVTCKVSGPGMLSFRSENANPTASSYPLYFYVDGVIISSRHDYNWHDDSSVVSGTGMHEVRWYQGSSSNYYSFLDKIEWKSSAESVVFDGSAKATLNGAKFPKKETNDFSAAITFSVGELSRINRLMTLGAANLYLNNDNQLVFNNEPTSLIVETANKYYTVVVRQNDNGFVTIYGGIAGEELKRVLETNFGTLLNFKAGDVSTGNVVFGSSSLPTPGFLTSGEMKNFRLWSRAITDTEARKIDVEDGRIKTSNNSVQGIANSHVPLDQNMYVSGSDGVAVNKLNAMSCGFYAADDRYGIKQRAMRSEGVGEIFIPDFRSLFTSKEIDASVSLWFMADELPSEGTVATLFQRYWAGRSSYAEEDKIVEVSINEAGGIELNNNGSKVQFSTTKIAPKEWHMITLVSKAKRTLQVYVDDVEIGNISSTITLGYFTPNDCTYGNYNNFAHAIFGAGKGVIDDLTIHHAALTSLQVREFYEATRPKPVLHTVTQGIQSAQLDKENFLVEAEGTNLEVALTVAQSVNWTATPKCDWIRVSSDESGAGSAKVAFTVDPTTVVTNRIGTLTIAGIDVTVEQKGLWADVDYDDTNFGVESDFGMIYVETEGAGMWTAETDCEWIHLLDDSGNGPGVVTFVIDDYSTTTQSRTGTITVAGKKVVITQQGYELSIDPMIADIGSNAGAGQFGVAAPIDAVWEAIADCDWITIIGSRTGIGDGTIQYTVKDNLTGETRTGRIVVGGKIYTITQRTTIPVTTQVVGKGKIVGAGNYNQGTKITLKATPDAGYVFSHWSGDAVGNDDSVEITVDIEKNVTATFIPEAAAQVLAEKKAAQGGFYTRDQIHALELGNLVLDVDASGTARIGVQLMESSDLSNWKAVDMSAGSLDVGRDGTVGMNVKATGNAKFYKVVASENK